MLIFESLGRKTIDVFRQLGAIILLFFATLKEFRQVKIHATAIQCLNLGVMSFPIVALTLLFTGMVLSVQVASELVKYGAGFTAGALISVSLGEH